ncbi:TetR/AcrR family transcriptional regulator [Sphingobium algorifonticola]|uniref:TetR/AcrR family transcriptional regulator n=2 Tax=Sphingobium algorifonticola TaxID=2008318 RepID=A0A437J5W6_9SPHN|nr:TetR/AcrR family transcriptional regulator [Sphingobium algorifonticola]
MFAQDGYGGASVDTIAAAAGYSKGAFYGNFDSKEAIFLEVLERHMAAEAAQLSRLVDAGRTVGDILDSVDAWLDSMNADADWALLAMELQLQARRSPGFAVQHDALYARHRQRLGGLITRLFSMSGKRLPVPAEELAAAMMALAHGLVLQRTQYVDGSDPAGPLIKTVLRSLLAAGSPL